MKSSAVVFEKLHEDVRVPERSTARSAGYDVRAYLKARTVRVYSFASEDPVDVSVRVEPASGGDDRAGRPDPDGSRRAEGTPAPRGPRLVLQPGDRALVPTGFKARLPEGYEAQLRVRSSLAYRKGLIVPNAPGTVDADYPDEWFVLIQNASGRPQAIRHGERIAQIVLNRYEVLRWEPGQVRITTDRVGGLGSTGR
ncbi:MAG: dUTP diphosphatase [Gemmatimonadota bacterium]